MCVYYKLVRRSLVGANDFCMMYTDHGSVHDPNVSTEDGNFSSDLPSLNDICVKSRSFV